jgi:hypothetical protein
MKSLKNIFTITLIAICISLSMNTNVAAKKQKSSAYDLSNELCLGIENYMDGLTKNYLLPLAKGHFNTIITTPNSKIINTKAWLSAHLFMGIMYYFGNGVNQSYQQALTHLNIIIDPTNNARTHTAETWIAAQYFIGIMHYNGHGIEQSFSNALTYFYNVINPSNNAQTINPALWLDTHRIIGMMHYFGQGVAQNFRKRKSTLKQSLLRKTHKKST